MNLAGLMRNFTIRLRMWCTIIAVAASVLSIGGVGIAAQRYANSVTQSFLKVDFASTIELKKVRAAMDAMRLQEKHMIIQYENNTEAEAGLKAWNRSHDDAMAATKALMEFLPDEENRGLAAEAGKELTKFKVSFLPWAKAMLELRYPSTMVSQAMLDKFLPNFHAAQTALSKVEAAVVAGTDAGSARMQSVADSVVWLISGAVGLTLLLIVPLTLLNMRSICHPIVEAKKLAMLIAQGDLAVQDRVDVKGKDETASLLRSLSDMQESLLRMVCEVRSSTNSLRDTSAELANGNQDLSTRTEQTASSLQLASSATGQLMLTVQRSVDSARQANQLAASAAEVAGRGGQVVTEVVSTMNEINSSSKEISDIIGVIDGIAFQTNILALNAAVEAARAGEQGRGFAVVAAEVRTLAGRCAAAAKEIKTLIGTSVDKVETGSRLVADAGKTMTEIVGSVQRVSDIISEITAASKAQSDGINQVNAAMVQLDQMTQQNAALVEQATASAESMTGQVGRLTQVVSMFNLDNTSAVPSES